MVHSYFGSTRNIVGSRVKIETANKTMLIDFLIESSSDDQLCCRYATTVIFVYPDEIS